MSCMMALNAKSLKHVKLIHQCDDKVFDLSFFLYYKAQKSAYIETILQVTNIRHTVCIERRSYKRWKNIHKYAMTRQSSFNNLIYKNNN